ncbi:hypothetical protein Ahy_B05g077303 [Arachis hypogaea]|uniref:PB1-like domain-containing protein n=1 Tax=Arachis hypogaea TaxID=3818 RepID=A0A444Z564_ARAHY|nr:hypothetical protein Ahy_B05g077303 [Arachis hypogaea]
MSSHITLVYYHRGRLEKNSKGVTVYSGGQVSLIPRVNVDTLNLFFMERLFKDLRYIHWKGKPDARGGVALKLLRLDRDVVNMYEDAIRNDDRVVHVYWEHTVDIPTEVEVVDVDAEEMPTSETEPSNVNANTVISPSGRTKKKAQRTLKLARILRPRKLTTTELRGKQKNRRNSCKRPAPSGQTFVQGGIGEAQKIFVPRTTSESSECDDDDSNPDYHQYESEELHSPYSSDCDSDYEAKHTVWPQGNLNATFGTVHLELGMEFETMDRFKRAVRKFNIQIGRRYPPLPLYYKTPIGRPTKKRRKERNEVRPNPNPHKLKRRYRTIICNYCGENANNVATAPRPKSNPVVSTETMNVVSPSMRERLQPFMPTPNLRQ